MSYPFLLVDRLFRNCGTDHRENRQIATWDSTGAGEPCSVEWIIEKPNLWDGLFLTPLPRLTKIKCGDLLLSAERIGKRITQIRSNGSKIGSATWPSHDRSSIKVVVSDNPQPFMVKFVPSLESRMGDFRRQQRFEVDREVLAYIDEAIAVGISPDSEGKLCKEVRMQEVNRYDEKTQLCFLAALFLLIGMRRYYQCLEQSNPG